MASRLGLVSCIAVVCAALAFAGQTAQSLAGDNSDWFSIATKTATVDLSARQTHTQHRELASSTFKVAAINVGTGEINRAEGKFGKTIIVRRGDAGSTRNQGCYISNDSKAYLIFEEDGEGFGGSFYLFNPGPKWNGSQFCSKLPLNSERIQTASGLHLGLSEDEVKKVLGTPSTTSPNTLTYTFEVEEKTFVTSFVVAKFASSKLVYLAVEKFQSSP